MEDAMSKLLPWSLLRMALLADAIASGAMGVVLAAGAGPLADWFGLSPLLLQETGLFLIPYAGLLVYLASRTVTPRAPAMMIVAGNLLWVAGSVLLLAIAAPTSLGIAFVIAQALIVAILAEAQFIGLRRQRVAVA
jgi:hypothetical protein